MTTDDPMALAPSGAGRDGCGATTRGGSPCTQAAGWGTSHPGFGNCKLHGGSTPNGEKHATQVQARVAVARLLHDVDAEPVRDAVGALQAFAGRLLNAESVVGERVNRLTSLGDVDEKGAQQIRAEVAVLLELLKLIRATLADMGRLNIEERAQRLDEAKAAVVVAVLLDVLGGYGVDVNDTQVRAVVAGALERVGAA